MKQAIVAGIPFDGGLSGVIPIAPSSERYRIVSEWPERCGDDVELVVLSQNKQFRRVLARLMRGEDGRLWLVQLPQPYPWEKPGFARLESDVEHALLIRSAETELEILDRLSRLEVRVSTLELEAKERGSA